nr:NADH dehydrogenase subunit 2 [Abarenicola claparedi oceanica]
MNNMKPSSLFFSTTLMLGIMMVLSSNNWFTIWMGLELNLYSFIPLMMSSNNNQEKEAAIKYFLTQALGSGALLLGMTTAHQNNFTTALIFLALLLKTGMAPLHFWFPSVMMSLSWPMCMILSTIQKLAPMSIMITTTNSSPNSIMIVSGLSALWGGLGGLNQTQLRAILAYSSIGHMGWILAASLYSTSLSFMYFATYIVMLTPIMLTLWSSHLKANNQPSTNLLMKPSLMILLLSLGGLPPLLGFFPKLLVLYSLINLNMFPLAIILIMGSTINLFYYMKIFYSSFFTSNLPHLTFTPQNKNMPTLIIMSTLSTMTGSIILLPWLIT